MKIGIRRLYDELRLRGSALLLYDRERETLGESSLILLRRGALPDRLPGASLFFGEAWEIDGRARQERANVLCVPSAAAETAERRAGEILASGVGDGEYVSRRLFSLACEGSLQNIADAACALMGNPAAVYDAHGRNVAYSRLPHPKAELFRVYTRDLGLAEKRAGSFFRAECVERIRRERAPMLFEGAASRRIIAAPVFTNGMFSGYINIVEAYAPFADGDEALAGDLAMAASAALRRSGEPAAGGDELHGGLLRELLESPTIPRAYAEERVRSAGLMPGQAMLMAAVCVPDGTFAEGLRGVLHTERDGRGAALLTLGEISVPALVFALEKRSLKAALSGPFDDLRETAGRYRQALAALNAAERLKKPGAVFRFHELAPYCLLGEGPFPPEDCLHPAVRSLRAYDEAHGTQLLPTLGTYLQNVRSLVATKDALHIHRSTLVYRLERIEEITGADLTDGETFFELAFSFKALDMTESKGEDT
ncbi:MAG: helix-turn-helix domain-containing protein [Oscillospiraceae bacterium]|nr:helix-turn-helix domain-containing protein [Oscillospiraceae bacterium]